MSKSSDQITFEVRATQLSLEVPDGGTYLYPLIGSELLELTTRSPLPPPHETKKNKKNIIGYCSTKWKMKSYLTSNSSDNNFISFLRKNIAIRFGIETKATTTYAMFQTTVVSITAAKIKHKT